MGPPLTCNLPRDILTVGLVHPITIGDAARHARARRGCAGHPNRSGQNL